MYVSYDHEGTDRSQPSSAARTGKRAPASRAARAARPSPFLRPRRKRVRLPLPEQPAAPGGEHAGPRLTAPAWTPVATPLGRSPRLSPPRRPDPRSLTARDSPLPPQSPGAPPASTPENTRHRPWRTLQRADEVPAARAPQRDARPASALARTPASPASPRALHARAALGSRVRRGRSEVPTARHTRQRVSQRRRPCTRMKQGANAERRGCGHSDIGREASLQPLSRERDKGTGGVAEHLTPTPPKAPRPSLWSLRLVPNERMERPRAGGSRSPPLTPAGRAATAWLRARGRRRCCRCDLDSCAVERLPRCDGRGSSE